MFKFEPVNLGGTVLHIALQKVISVEEAGSNNVVTMENDEIYYLTVDDTERLIKALHLFWGASL